MLGEGPKRWDVDRRIVSGLISSTRANLSAVAKSAGVSQPLVRSKVKRLFKSGLIDFKPLFSARLLGNVAALVRIKSERRESLAEFLSKCNRSVGVMFVNQDEIVAILYGREKRDIINVLSVLRHIDDSIREIEIVYGKLPSQLMVPLKNPAPDCHTRACEAAAAADCCCLPPLSVNKH